MGFGTRQGFTPPSAAPVTPIVSAVVKTGVVVMVSPTAPTVSAVMAVS